ncbi:MAG: LA2681 family HEPN domain-containing protein [Tepidisphaeraceae bacterium]
MPIDEALRLTAELIDGATDRADEGGLELALRGVKSLLDKGAPAGATAHLHYMEANAWAGLARLRQPDERAVWAWRQPEVESELLALRRARHGEGFDALPAIRQAQILTNEANVLDTLGRSLDAIALYRRAQRLVPRFGMAGANLGVALLSLAVHHYDPGQVNLLMHAAWRCLTGALREHLEPGAAAYFDERASVISSRYPAEFLNNSRPFDEFSLGRTKSERAYRTWALEKGLFLNPLNALGAVSIAARDTLQLPGVVQPLNEGTGLLGMFQQIKQEFVSARYLAWEGVELKAVHFSDRDTLLVNTLDYAAYGLGLEKLKLAYRMAYSLLDKCAFLLNKYFGFGLKDNEVNLNRIWFVGGKQDRAKPNANLNPAIVDTANWPLRGLFWIARDLHDRDALADPIDPDAKELKAIRDHLEHKYLKVVEWTTPSDDKPDGLRDQYATPIAQGALEQKLLHLLSLARSAIVYTALGVHCEERRRQSTRQQDGIVAPLHFPMVDDRFKR